MAIDVNINNQNKHWILVVLEKVKSAILAVWWFVVLIFRTIWSLIVKFFKGVVWLFKKIWKILVGLIVLAGLVFACICGYKSYYLNKATTEIKEGFYSSNDSIKEDYAIAIIKEGYDWKYEKVEDKAIDKRIHKYRKEAFEYIESQAYKGNSNCQFHLGSMYYLGYSTPKDEIKAAYWWNEAAKQGLRIACDNMGFAYMNGVGVNVDYRKAVEFFKKTAEFGSAYGQCHYGDLLAEGVYEASGEYMEYVMLKNEFFTCDVSDETFLYMNEESYKACEKFNTVSNCWIKNRETRYCQPRGDRQKAFEAIIEILPKDIEQAKYWWRKAAAQGNEVAKDRLQKIYE